MSKMKAYTLGNNGFVPADVIAAIGEPRHIRQANVLVVAASKRAASLLVDQLHCGRASLSDPEFRLSGWPVADQLVGLSDGPAVYVTPMLSRGGAPVVQVDFQGVRRIGRLERVGPNLAFVAGTGAES